MNNLFSQFILGAKFVYFALAATFLLILFSACCNEDPVEIGRYELQDYEKTLLPYEQDSLIPFKHSNGYSFDMNVVESSITWNKMSVDEDCRCCYEYYSYQKLNVVLQSDYPHWNINLYISKDLAHFNEKAISININNWYTGVVCYDTLGNYISQDTSVVYRDSIKLNGTFYYNVYEKILSNYTTIPETTVIPTSVLINNTGLLQIKMTNNETYTINL